MTIDMANPPVWHAGTSEAALAELGTTENGLSVAEAARRLRDYGPNALQVERPDSWIRILLNQLLSVVVFLLIGAAAISFLLGDTMEAAAIAVVLAINTVLGFVIDLRARLAMEALRKLDVPHATVVRGGRVETVDARVLVPGDVIELRAGQAVPADARIITTSDLRTNEAALTGESLPVSKKRVADSAPDTPLADRVTMIYKGTSIAGGTARAVVTATGGATELGRIGRLVASIRQERTPLERRLDALGRRLVWVALAAGALVSAMAAGQGEPLGLVLRMGIALAVAAVPEALPAVATIALAIGLQRMARRHALVRRLPAVESLGSTTIVCTDKTQTLTSGDMTVSAIWAGEEFAPPGDRSDGAALDPRLTRALETGALASPEHSADPVDAAFLQAAGAAGVKRNELIRACPRIGIVPFSTERKLTASFHEDAGGVTAHVKGAPEQIVDLCDGVTSAAGRVALDEDGRARLLDVNRDLAARGFRVLGLARGSVAAAEPSALSSLECLGFGGLMDPPAAGVKDTIARLKSAGLRTIMITGDQRLTAEAVARDLGLLDSGEVIEGRELAALTPADLQRRLPHVVAFSRVSPEDKLTVVRALQASGEIVAMLGDGVNDAAALRQADVGVAMGVRGTDVAKDASAIVLQDDRFETIAAAVEQGRIIYDNIQKFVFYLFSCNLAEVLSVVAAGVAGLPLPLLPLQILWLNIVTDTFPALALAVEPGDPDVMRRPPRDPQGTLLSGAFLTQVLFSAVLITGVTLAAYLWALQSNPDQARTLGFMTLALSQIFHLRTARRFGLSPRRTGGAPVNRYAVGALVLTLGLQLAAVAVPGLAQVLDLEPMSPSDWAIVLGLSLVPVGVNAVADFLRKSGPDRMAEENRL